MEYETSLVRFDPNHSNSLVTPSNTRRNPGRKRGVQSSLLSEQQPNDNEEEEEEKQIPDEGSEYFNNEDTQRSRRRLIDAPRPLYENVYRAIAQEGYEEPEFYIPELQQLVTEYTGGTCDAVTEGRQRCWTQSRIVTTNGRLNYSCSEYCLQGADEWLLPVLLSMPTRLVYESSSFNQSRTIDFSKGASALSYDLMLDGLQHRAVDSIAVTVMREPGKRDYLFCGISSSGLNLNKLRSFLEMRDEIQNSLQQAIPAAQIDQVERYANAENDINYPNAYSTPGGSVHAVELEYSVQPGLPTEELHRLMETLFDSIVEPVLAASTGARLSYSIIVDVPYKYETSPLRSELQFINTLQTVNPNTEYNLRVPEFPDPNASWRLEAVPTSRDSFTFTTEAFLHS
jgi:hypothetical protein